MDAADLKANKRIGELEKDWSKLKGVHVASKEMKGEAYLALIIANFEYEDKYFKDEKIWGKQKLASLYPECENDYK